MATGYEDWIRLRVTDPATALERLYMHMQILQEQASGARTQADGVAFDPQPLLLQLGADSFLMREANRLEGVVHGVGVARLVPTRRVDGGTVTAPDTAFGS